MEIGLKTVLLSRRGIGDHFGRACELVLVQVDLGRRDRWLARSSAPTADRNPEKCAVKRAYDYNLEDFA